MQKIIRLTVLFLIVTTAASAQYRYRGRMYSGGQPQQRYSQTPTRQQVRESFRPTFSLSFGYGFPNLDKNEMLEFLNYYPGTTSQKGPFLVSADYQFNRTTAIGVTVNYGKVSRSYFYQNDVQPNFTGKLENTAIMLNLTRYIPATKTVSPYIRTAVGINIPHSSYTNDVTGAVITRVNDDNTLAYQASLGVKLNFTPRAGLFAEAGYGKYIVAGGLSFTF